MRTWQLEDAWRRFTEVVDLALAGGPQRVTHHGRGAVVIVSEQEWRRLCESRPPFGTLLASFPAEADDLPARRPARIVAGDEPG
jgi:prevent-host-death family protein